MKAARIWASLLALFVVAGAVSFIAKSGDDGLSAAAREINTARAEGKPALLLFMARICTACLDMEKVVEGLRPEFADEAAFVVVDFNVEENEALIEEFGVDVIPVVFILDRAGERTAKIVGAGKDSELRDALSSAVKANSRGR